MAISMPAPFRRPIHTPPSIIKLWSLTSLAPAYPNYIPQNFKIWHQASLTPRILSPTYTHGVWGSCPKVYGVFNTSYRVYHWFSSSRFLSAVPVKLILTNFYSILTVFKTVGYNCCYRHVEHCSHIYKKKHTHTHINLSHLLWTW